ncbi:tetratricopeptide repeat protein [Micromonospora sp. NPDC050417]|uniref:tetratricopeptide repeat protein n=1 Tax=Micromonospora sp. NPDC050417 TaxID=3364280 RepID=UPI0037AC1A93
MRLHPWKLALPRWLSDVVGGGLALLDRARRRPGTLPIPARQVVFGAIPAPARHFQQRPILYARVKQALAAGNGTVALVGVNGAGASQLAAAYARECVETGYASVAWVDATSGFMTGPTHFSTRLELFDDDLKPRKQAQYAWSAMLAHFNTKRLVVFDNVENPTRVGELLPRFDAVEVIITGAGQEVATMHDVTAIVVPPYTAAEGRAFLAEAASLRDDPAVDELGDRLDWLPLGLAQAATHIAQHGSSCGEYLIALDSHVLDGAPLHSGVHKAVALSLAGLRHEDPTGLAERLLTVLSVMSIDGVRQALVTGEAAQAALQTDAASMATALRLLSDALLLTTKARSDGSGADIAVLAVHRITAQVVRSQADRSSSVTLTDGVAAAVRMLSHYIDTAVEDDDSKSGHHELVTHITALGEHSPEWTAEFLTLYAWAGESLHDAGDLHRAVPMLQTTYDERERILGRHHPDTRTSRFDLAGVYRSAGRFDEAVGIYQAIVDERHRELGPEHIDTREARYSLAQTYEAAGRLSKAISIYEAIVAARERELGAGHPGTGAVRTMLAHAYAAAGRHDEAITLHRAIVEERERDLGHEHPETLTSRSNLASAYESAGLTAEAIRLFRAIVADNTRLLGRDHLSTLTSRNNLAQAYESAGWRFQAIATYQATAGAMERVLGPGHHSTLTVRSNLAHIYRRAGMDDEAARLLESIVADEERLLGADHPNTLTSKTDLAHLYRVSGRQQEAVHLFEVISAGCERMYGAAHPITLISRSNLALGYRWAGRPDEAIGVFITAVRDQERVLGAEHEVTLDTRQQLAYAYGVAGRREEAVTLFQALFADLEDIHGPDHPDTLSARGNLAYAYAAAGHLDEAIALYQAILAHLESTLNPDDPAIATVRDNLEQIIDGAA